MRLSDFLDEAYQEYSVHKHYYSECKHIEDFLYNKDKCLRLLYHFLDLGSDSQHYHELNLVNIYRCQHIFVTFLLGLGINNVIHILNGTNVINKLPDEYLWMLTSIIHDYGYLMQGVSEEQSIERIDGRYHLLEDEYAKEQLERTKDYSLRYPQYLTYSYDTIKRYYNYQKSRLNEYAKESNITNNNEMVDHGIYGACKCYEDYCDFFIQYEYPRNCIEECDIDKVKSMGYQVYRLNHNPQILKLARTEPVLYKTACLITAQHNMFRSTDSQSDVIYQEYGLDSLLSTTPISVNKNNPLLFLLSIVDTIESTKRFESIFFDDRKGTRHEFGIPIKKVLDSIEVNIDCQGITIDFTKFEKYIEHMTFLFNGKTKRKTLCNVLESQIDTIVDIQKWVDCMSYKIGDFIVRISIH